MGGKTKQKQRTKNNTKPSNSGRSAELLGSSASRNFVGFANVTQLGLFPTVLHDTNIECTTTGDDIESLLDSNYQLVLRKMGKKDPTTKVKALQEFGDLVANTELVTIKTILPFWPRLYNNLSNDVEHRVREATQQAHAAIVSQAGKNIAPHLKQMVPMWIMSQYDTYAPVASIAVHSFEKSFPAHKQQDVFNFCHNELLDSITKNLIILPANSAQECEAKHHRILISSLKGYASYLTKMSSDNLEKALAANLTLLDSEKFWAYQRNENAHVRAAWFDMICGLLQQTTIDLAKYQKKISIATLLNVDEKETVVLPYIWTAILLAMQKFNNWHTHISMEKAFLPKLWKLLRAGGHGSAEIIYPHFLILISNWKVAIFGDKLPALYENFLQNISAGLQSQVETQSTSRSELKAISTAYFECLKYILLSVQSLPAETFDANTTSDTFSLQLIQLNIIDLIGFLLDNSRNGRFVLPQLIDLVHFWCQTSETNQLHASFDRYFWTNAYNAIENGLAKSTDNHDALELIQQMVQLMYKLGQNHGKAKSAKIKFSDNSEVSGDCVDGILKSPNNSGKHNQFRAKTMAFVVKLSQLYIKNTSANATKQYLTSLDAFFTQYAGDTEFVENVAGSAASIQTLCDQFGVWLNQETTCSELVLNMTLILYTYVEPSAKVKLLDQLVKSNIENVAGWMLLRLLTHPFCTEPEVQRLISEPTVTANIIKNATAFTRENVGAKINLLHKCFFQMDTGSFLIDDVTCQRIIECLCDTLIASDTDSTVLDACVRFLAQIMPVICCDEKKNAIRNRMFVHLFGLCVDQKRLSTLNEDTVWEALTSWQDTLSSNDIQLDETLLQCCADTVGQNVNALLADDESTAQLFDSIAEVISKLILCSVERFDDEDESKNQHVDNVIAMMFNKFSAKYESLRTISLSTSTFVELANGKVVATPTVINWLGKNPNAADTMQSAQTLIKLGLFKFQTVFKMTCNMPKMPHSTAAETQQNDEQITRNIEEEHTEDYCDLNEVLLKQWTPKIYAEIDEAIYLVGLFNSYQQNFKLPATFEASINQFNELIGNFLQHIPESNLSQIIANHTNAAKLNDPFVVRGTQLFENVQPYANKENASTLLFEDLLTVCDGSEHLDAYLSVLLAYTPKLAARQIPITPIVFNETIDLHHKSIGLRCFLRNYFKGIMNETGDQQIVVESVHLIEELFTQSKENRALFMYDADISEVNEEDILRLVDYMQFLGEVLRYSFSNITKNGWDFIRIALSSWVLTASKSSRNWKLPKVGIFIAAVYELFSTVNQGFEIERQLSSTRLLTEVIDEWDQIFAKDINLILLKCFRYFVESTDSLADSCHAHFFEILCKATDELNYKYFMLSDMRKVVGEHLQFAITQVANKSHTIQLAATRIIRRLSTNLINEDLEQLNRTEQGRTVSEWHLLHKFRQVLQHHSEWARQYIDEFTFKLTELDELSAIPTHESMSFLLLWHCILDICKEAPSEVRSIYASYLTDEQFDVTMLQMLFRLMPVDVLRNPDNKSGGAAYFTAPTLLNIRQNEITPERYACYIYQLALKYLPALVRRWWTNSQARQKAQVDKITTSFVSTQLCADEYRTLLDKKAKHDSFQIAVHASTREIHATYTVDEARMELIIQLPLNYPLGAVKVSCGQQIGDKLQSKLVVMQLSIFLTHQNGSIWDGLTLWKRNLDRKFEGVEECYVCYSVIHQETCQLPKLTCKTCRKKFHGQCLYKWFNTSNKSTCPICRNIF